ncbi:Protein kinase domain/Protein tyrosine kinase [Novymonas esmeraldas]|uniref:non-specific serine/threonine protein kinase n=1 Tax=Novymonas esmeraldas TaxID=1808958 RepID=A0AAW0FBP6_9TRYP
MPLLDSGGAPSPPLPPPWPPLQRRFSTLVVAVGLWWLAGLVLAAVCAPASVVAVVAGAAAPAQCTPRVAGWALVPNATLDGIGHHAAAIPIGQHILVLGGVAHIRDTVDAYTYVTQRTKRRVNLVHSRTYAVAVPVEVDPNTSSTACSAEDTSVPPRDVGAAARWDSGAARCIDPSSREGGAAPVQLRVPVVGTGSVVRVRDRVYAIGACNTILDSVDISVLQQQQQQQQQRQRQPPRHGQADDGGAAHALPALEEYLRSVLRLRFFHQRHATTDAYAMHQEVMYLPSNMTLRVNATCVAGADGVIYIVGGINARTGEALASVAQFDTNTDAFVEGVWSLPQPAITAAATSSNDVMFIGGGFAIVPDPSLLHPGRTSRVYRTNVAVVDTRRSVYDAEVARYAADDAGAAALQWTSPQLFAHGARLFMLGSSSDAAVAYQHIAMWADMSKPLQWQRHPRTSPAGAPRDKGDAPAAVMQTLSLAFAPTRRDAAAAVLPEANGGTTRFYLFGGRLPSSAGDDDAAQQHIFVATVTPCSSSSSSSNNSSSSSRGGDDKDSAAPPPTLRGFSYTRVMKHAVAGAAVPNDLGNTSVYVNGYQPLWYNIAFEVLLPLAEVAQACPGVRGARQTTASTSTSPAYSTCAVVLSTSPLCDAPIAEFHYLSPRNTRLVQVPTIDAEGTVTGYTTALAVGRTVLIGSLRRGLVHALQSAADGRRDGSSVDAAFDDRAAGAVATALDGDAGEDPVPSNEKLYYEHSLLHVCFSRGPSAIANCSSATAAVAAPPAAPLAVAAPLSSSLWSSRRGRLAAGATGQDAECSSHFFVALSAQTRDGRLDSAALLLSPETTWTPGDNDSSSDSAAAPPPSTPAPSPPPRRRMLLAVCIALCGILLLGIPLTFVCVPSHALRKMHRRAARLGDPGAGNVNVVDADGRSTLDRLRYSEARLLLSGGSSGGGGGAGAAEEDDSLDNNVDDDDDGGGGGCGRRRGRRSGGDVGLVDDLLDEYETALTAAGVGTAGIAGLGDMDWDERDGRAPHRRGRHRRLLDGKYEVKRKLGRGSFSIVYLVRRITDGKRFALKYVQCSDDVDRHEAMKECELVYALQGHPNVIQLFDMFMSYRFDRHMVAVPGTSVAATQRRARPAAAGASRCTMTTAPPESSTTGGATTAPSTHSSAPPTSDETSVAACPVVRMDSAYLDAVAGGFLHAAESGGSGDGPQQSQPASDTRQQHAPLQAERYLSLVMAYHERGDLARWVRQRRALQPVVPEATIVSIGFQVLSLLAHMHHRHHPPIIHRDLKPENILLTSHVHYEDVSDAFLPIVVTDFGLSRVMDKTFCETGVGSLPYVAPECWQRRYSTKVDIWAVGCILYAVCSKRVDSSNVKVMFSDSTHSDFHVRLREEITNVYGYSPALAWFITCLLVVNPDDRPTAAEALHMMRRQPTDDAGVPLFDGPPLSTLLRAPAPPQELVVDGARLVDADGPQQTRETRGDESS